jgi:hypothetical protein
MNHAGLIEKLPTLRHKRRATYVVGRLHVISQRAMQLLDSLSDRQRHLVVRIGLSVKNLAPIVLISQYLIARRANSASIAFP